MLQVRQLRKDAIDKAKKMTSPQKKRRTPADLGLTSVKKEVADMRTLDVAYGIKNIILRSARSILAGTGDNDCCREPLLRFHNALRTADAAGL
eukprot:SAG31_NODE_735_length_12488_cov_7.086044_9_plen_93_part_00